MEFVYEIAVILLLLVANGVFAMAEIAVVSARKAKLKDLAEKGSAGALRALALAEAPNRFLSTVQVGITMVGIVAGAYGGAKLSEDLAALLKPIPVLGPYSSGVAFGVVVVCISYLSLIIGELVPKRIGLSNPERISSLLAGPMSGLSRLASPLVWLLSASTDAALKLLRLKHAPEAGVTEDELRLLAREGLRVGVLHPAESAMVESVLTLDKLRVSDLMTPRAKIIWIHVEEPHDRIWHKVVVSAHTTFPVYGETRDQVLGVITVKAIYANLAAGVPVRVRDLMVSPLVVPSTQNALQLLETFKRAGRHLAMVVDEFGTITGLVTMHDVLEAIAGEFPTQGERLRPAARRREDGSWLVDAMIPIDQFAAEVKDFPLDPAEAREYETFAGFVVSRLGRVPREGECFVCGAYTVEIIDMDGHRVDKVLLLPAKAAG